MKSFTVNPSSTNIKVDSLEVYTKYGIVLLAFNDAGNGPNTSQPIYVQTLEGGKYYRFDNQGSFYF